MDDNAIETSGPNNTPDAVPAPPAPGAAREGEDERRGEGGYGNDTGFATGSVAPRDDDPPDDTSAREEHTRAEYGGGSSAGDR